MSESLFVDETPPGSPYNPDDIGAAPSQEQLLSQVQSSYDAVREAARARDEVLVPKLESIPFVAEIVRELLAEDHLAVMARGLGLYEVAAALIMITDVAGTQRTKTSGIPFDKENLVLVIGATQRDIEHIQAELDRLSDVDLSTRGLVSLTAETSAPKRTSLYNAGGVFSVTTRILVVDMLTGAIPTNMITGVIVINAERVDDTSNEAFILRLLRSKNPHAFIKALSDYPDRISPGLNGLSMRLRSLGVPKVALWPRFHLQVSDCLGNRQINECIVELSESMKLMQAQVTELLQACISDIKRRVPTIDTESWTVDTAMKTDLARTVRVTLYSQWHRISHDGQRSVEDLATLQDLLSAITHYHPVELLRILQTYWYTRAIDTRNVSPWLLSPQAEALRELAIERVQIKEVLPKLEYLMTTLKELEGQPRVLIVVSDLATVNLVQRYLENGSQYLAQLEQEYNTWKMRAERSEPQNEKGTAEPVDERRGKRRRVRGTTRFTEGRPSSTPEPKEELKEESPVEIISVTEIKTELDFHPVVVTHSNVDILHALHPDVIIVYDLNMVFTRAIEMYRAGTQRDPGIYFMYYRNSIEEMRYLTDLRQEKDAFTNLIREKGNMPMVIIDPSEAQDGNDGPKVISTRIGGRVQSRVVMEKPRVIVDAREFRSSLPFLVWQAGIDVLPLTLLVGDYIVTPDICVERKTVTDLISSFQDGRLYAQCESMFRYYKTPVLLIEFGSDRSFSLEPFKEIRTASLERQSSIHGNLAMLLLKFPKLKLIWSASPRHTGEIFASLKASADEPDPVQCVQAGQEVVMNEAAQDMLQAIPGVNQQNSRLIMAKVGSLVELVEMDVDDLAPIVGREVAVKMVRFMRESE